MKDQQLAIELKEAAEQLSKFEREADEGDEEHMKVRVHLSPSRAYAGLSEAEHDILMRVVLCATGPGGNANAPP